MQFVKKEGLFWLTVLEVSFYNQSTNRLALACDEVACHDWAMWSCNCQEQRRDQDPTVLFKGQWPECLLLRLTPKRFYCLCRVTTLEIGFNMWSLGDSQGLDLTLSRNSGSSCVWW